MLSKGVARPLPQTILIFGLALVFYLILSRPANKINDFEVSGNTAYLAAGKNGIRILDVENPTNLHEVAKYRCSPIETGDKAQATRLVGCANDALKLQISNNQLILANGRRGVFLYNINDNPQQLTLVSRLPVRGSARDLVVIEDFIYIASGRQGIQIAQIEHKNNKNQESTGSATTTLSLLSDNTIKGNYQRIFSDGNFLYAVDNRRNLVIFNLKNSKNPEEINKIKFKFQIRDIEFTDLYAFLATGEDGLQIASNEIPTDFSIISQLDTKGSVNGVFIQGYTAYLADGNQGLVLTDITDPLNPRIIQEPKKVTGTSIQVQLQGDIAYLSTGVDGFYALETSVDIKTKLLGQSGAQLTVLGVSVSDKYAYLAAGERGLRIIDISNPNKPVQVGFADTPGRADAIAISGDVAYVADRTNGIVLFDVTTRTGDIPQLQHIATQDAIDVALLSGYTYVADKKQGLIIMDSRQPAQTTIVQELSNVNGQPISPVGVTVSGNYAYLSELDKGVRIINIVDKTLPTQVQQAVVVGQADARNAAVIAYNNQTPGQDPYNPDINSPNTRVYAYVANGIFGLQVLDVTNPQSNTPVLLNLDQSITTLPGVAMDVVINRDRAYLAYDGGGVYILDTTNPATPKLVGVVNLTDAEKRAVNLAISGKLMYLAAVNNGLKIYDVNDTANPALVGQLDAPETIKQMAVRDGRLYSVDGSRGMWIFDVDNPEQPKEISSLSVPQASSVSLLGEYAYLGVGSAGLTVVNVSEPKSPQIISNLDTPGYATYVLAVPNSGSLPIAPTAYIADTANGLVVVDISNPTALKNLAGLTQIGNAAHLAYNGLNYLYVSSGDYGLTAINVDNPANPVRMKTEKINPTSLGSVVVSNAYLYVAAGNGGMPIQDVSYPLNMTSVDVVSSGDQWIQDVSIIQPTIISGTLSTTISVQPNYAFLANLRKGISILDTTDPVKPVQRGAWEAPGGVDPYTNEVSQPEIVQVIGDWLPPAADGDKPGTLLIYVADKIQGFYILNGVKEAKIEILSFYETSGAPTFRALWAYVLANLKGIKDYPYTKPPGAINQFLLDFFLFGLAAWFLWIGFLAFFVLPVDRFRDWVSLYSRKIIFLFGRHGPLVRVSDGRVIQQPGEEVRPGPGVLLVSPGNAVLLERRPMSGGRANQSPPPRVIGPGLAFSGNRHLLSLPRFDETVRAVTDLRPQIRITGNVNASTRDGIEVQTGVFSIFSLGNIPDFLRLAYVTSSPAPENELADQSAGIEPAKLQIVSLVDRGGQLQIQPDRDEIIDGEDFQEITFAIDSGLAWRPYPTWLREQEVAERNNGSPYNFDPVRIFQAVYGHAGQNQDQPIIWTDLPNYIGRGIFRDLLAAEDYDGLYLPALQEISPGIFPLQQVRRRFSRMIRNQGVLSFQVLKRPNGKPFLAGETISESEVLVSQVQPLANVLPLNRPKILRARGISVINAGFIELTPTQPGVRERFFENWRAHRQRETDTILAELDLRALRVRNEWRSEAQREILNELINILDNDPQASEALAMHVLQALENAATDPETRPLMQEQTINMLRNLHGWLLHS